MAQIVTPRSVGTATTSTLPGLELRQLFSACTSRVSPLPATTLMGPLVLRIQTCCEGFTGERNSHGSPICRGPPNRSSPFPPQSKSPNEPRTPQGACTLTCTRVMNRPAPTTKQNSTPPRTISRRHVRQNLLGGVDWSSGISIRRRYGAPVCQVSLQTRPPAGTGSGGRKDRNCRTERQLRPRALGLRRGFDGDGGEHAAVPDAGGILGRVGDGGGGDASEAADCLRTVGGHGGLGGEAVSERQGRREQQGQAAHCILHLKTW